MKPAEMAALHAACFETPRPWSEAEFADLLKDDTVRIFTRQHALAIYRIAGPEAELLTVCVAPDARRSGAARGLIGDAENALSDEGVQEVFLEVATTNSAARALYEKAGFAKTGVRKDYYRTPRGERVSAVVLKKNLR